MFVSFDKAVEILKSGHLVAMPTETVYGLAGRFDSASAIAEIFSTKKRPFFDPLIVHVGNSKQAQGLVSEWSEAAEVLAQKFWPGPLTLVLPKSKQVDGMITSGLDTVGVRCPDHPLARQLIEQVGVPLAAPSANLFGQTSPTHASHVETEFQSRVAVLDGGASLVGIESTVLLLKSDGKKYGFSILRQGKVHKNEIEQCLKNASLEFYELKDLSKNQSPGQMKHHYMPSVPLVYCLRIPRNEDHLRTAIETQVRNIPDVVDGVRIKKPQNFQQLTELLLSPDPVLGARELYQKLRDLGQTSSDLIYFIEPSYFQSGPNSELWLAVRDRLTKASSLILDEELA